MTILTHMAQVMRYKMPQAVPARSRPTLADLKAQARDALREEEGADFGPMSHAERNKILFGL
jgi:hypothetical protein